MRGLLLMAVVALGIGGATAFAAPVSANPLIAGVTASVARATIPQAGRQISGGAIAKKAKRALSLLDRREVYRDVTAIGSLIGWSSGPLFPECPPIQHAEAGNGTVNQTAYVDTMIVYCD